MTNLDKLVQEIAKDIAGAKPTFSSASIGVVREIKDEVAFIDGLADAQYGEMIEFAGGVRGMIVDLLEDGVGAIIFGQYKDIEEGSQVKGLGEIFSIPVTDAYIGRVVDGVGAPIDGGEAIKSKKTAFVDAIAPGVVTRKSVSVPVQTGIKAIDALIPVGRGQRQLIIGDRRTGKTTIAIDTILNQAGQDMICVYCAVGQRRSSVATVVELLKEKGAMDYTIVVAATASDSAAMQYIAPYTASTIAEHFMAQGKDVLVIYDDLSKHAWAYRQISLILRRPSGREAYPGDVFYLHSRLLERACRLNEEYGGGSITALPIIETLEGDVSAYIPTNVISITDGQIVVDTDLFNSGIRPAINVGASVSRVGGSAQTKAMKSVAGRLKFDLAQFRELAAFSQFESELDAETKKFIDRGSRMTQLLKQSQNNPYSLGKQVLIFYAATKGYFDEVDVNKISATEGKFLDFIGTHHEDLIKQIEKERIIDEGLEKKIESACKAFVETLE